MAEPDIGVLIGLLGTKEFEDAVKSAMGKVRTESKKSQSALDELGKEIPALGKAMRLLTNPVAGAAAVFTALAVGVFKTARAASEFNNEFLELRNLNLDKTSEQLETLNDTVLNTALKTGRAAKEVSKAFFDVQSATGLFGEDVNKVVTSVANFSTATKADLTESINSTVKAMRNFNIAAEDVDRLLKANVATVQLGITTFDELARQQVEYAGAAAAVGQSVETANKLFAAFTVTSKNTRIAATLVRAAFEDLTRGDTIEAFAAQGVRVFDEVTGKMRSTEDIVKDLNGALKNLSDEDFAAFKESVGGSQGIKTLLDQVKNQGDQLVKTFDDFDKVLKDVSNNGGFEMLLENAKGDFTTLNKLVGEQFNTIMVMLGQEILPPLAIVLNEITQLLAGLNDKGSALNITVKALNDTFDTTVLLLKALYAPGAAIKDIFEDIKAIWEGPEWWEEPIQKMDEGVKTLNSSVVSTKTLMDEWFKELMDKPPKVKRSFEGMFSFGGVQDFGIAPGATSKDVGSIVQDLFGVDAQAEINLLPDSLPERTKIVLDETTAELETFATKFQDVWKSVQDSVQNVAINAFADLAFEAGAALASVDGGFDMLIGSIKKFITTMLVEIPKIVGIGLIQSAFSPAGNLAFPTNLGIAAIGLGLLGLSGIMSGVLGGKKQEEGGFSAPSPSSPAGPSLALGLSSIQSGAQQAFAFKITNNLRIAGQEFDIATAESEVRRADREGR